MELTYGLMLLLVVWGPFSVWMLYRGVHKVSAVWVIVFTAGFLAVNVLAGLAMLNSFGSAFGLVSIMSCVYIPVILISLLLLLWFARLMKKENSPKQAYKIFLIAGVLVVFSQMFPSSIGYLAARRVCGEFNKRAARPVIPPLRITTGKTANTRRRLACWCLATWMKFLNRPAMPTTAKCRILSTMGNTAFICIPIWLAGAFPTAIRSPTRPGAG